MKIILTGANGYIGQRLIPVLLELGHELFCVVRDPARFRNKHKIPDSHIIQLDFGKVDKGTYLPKDLDVAFYLIHSMSSGGDFEQKEKQTAENFVQLIENTSCKQIIYLSGIVNAEKLSTHFRSRKNVEKILSSGKVPATVLRSGIIVGSGSASFEIIRDLAEKLPVMVAPKWVNTKTQPIAIRNVIEFLCGVLGKEQYYNRSFDIASEEILNYREILLKYAKVRGLKRWIFTVPVMTPRLSSYWLYFITSTSYSLAVNLVSSMKVDVVANENKLAEELGIVLIPYEKAVELAFQSIGQNMVLSSWKDAYSASGAKAEDITQYAELPEFGVYKDKKNRIIKEDKKEAILDKIWSIGGKNGWYYANWLWKIRGHLDKLSGGIGLRRGRTHPTEIHPGDALDFWRVIVADREKGRLLLFAEMKLPGEAWLEFKIEGRGNQLQLVQTALFRPLGVAGRLYWFSVFPFHYPIFNGMINELVRD
ncbi:MAG: SDR family oxidoreductase [Saprospirales bacterium]|nr:MAG: SDR family oxidoreductase [Saprospirales bacterium]